MTMATMSVTMATMSITPRVVLSLGVLYPGHAAEDDYPAASSRISPPVDVRVIHTTVAEDAHREDALRDTGSVERILAGVEELRPFRVAAAMWACTSGSFVFGLDGARHQARAIERALGVPSSSTSLAFVAASEHLGIRRVAVAATYPDEVSGLFIQLLADAGIETVHHGALGILTGAEVGALGHDQVVSLAASSASSEAEAILLPDTAMHTISWLDELEQVAGKPVLTANQVTVWQGLRLAGHASPQCGLGSLFRSMPTVSGSGR